jgi:hypothetical protein
MALPNPAVTWQMTALFEPDSTSIADFVAAVEAAVATLTGAQAWTTSSPMGDAAGLPATVLTPPAASPINGAITCIVGGSDGAAPLAAEILDSNPPVANTPLCSIGGAYATGNNWYDPSPYGAGIRYIELAPWSEDSLVVTHVFVIASAESIFIGTRVNDNQWYGTLMGAIFEPPDLGSAEADERIYGMFTSGTSNNYRITDPVTSNSTENWGRNNATAARAKGAYFDPTAPTTTRRCYMDRKDGEGAVNVTGWGVTAAGNPFFRAIYCRDFTTPFRPIGRLRGVYFFDRSWMRAIIQDAALNDRGFIVGGTTGNTPDEAVAFGSPVP